MLIFIIRVFKFTLINIVPFHSLSNFLYEYKDIFKIVLDVMF